FQVTLCDVEQRFLDRGLQTIGKNLDRELAKSKITADDRAATLKRIQPVLERARLADCDFVVEADTEKLEIKAEIFRDLDRICRPDIILASNTSSISITKLAALTKRPDKVIGMHFFNPVPVMKLVEVVRTIATDADVYEEMVAFGAKLGKTPVRAHDSTGFIVNRLLVPYLLDAIRAFEEGVGSIEDIDNSMKLGCGHPMGPLTLLDFVGLDTTYYISQIMFDEFHEKRFASPPLLKRMVLAGWNGRKAGKGFYDYSDPAKPKAMKF
ncbi:MAG: 3-hydroxyacyl-CoA dehydrogenase family protein, partial [bacterium]